MSTDDAGEVLRLPVRHGAYEASLLALRGGAVALFHDTDGVLGLRLSEDGGRRWSEFRPLRAEDGGEVRGFRTSPVVLRSGALGLWYNAPPVLPGRDGALLFRRAPTIAGPWATPTAVDDRFAVQRNGTGVVLTTGRLLAPAELWISPSLETAEADGLVYSVTYYSDDEGRTWERSINELVLALPGAHKTFVSFEEPAVAEIESTHLVMLGRTLLGRLYRSASSDGGQTWSTPEATQLASSSSPVLLQPLPRGRGLLAVWNQASGEEIQAGLGRHRLSSAVSLDGGVTWGDFRNLESLDDIAHVAPPPLAMYRSSGFHEPRDRQRYFRAPGPLRVSYPSIAFSGDQAVVAYDYGRWGGDEPPHGYHTTRVRLIPFAWFTAP